MTPVVAFLPFRVPCGPFRTSIRSRSYIPISANTLSLTLWPFDDVTTELDIYKQEIFGPVLSTVRTENYEQALSIAMDNEYGNGTAIFTRDGDTARDFANRINIGMVGINVPIPVPLAYHTFGGWKKSAFGDLNQHGPDAFRFYTRTKTITSRWPTGIKEGAKFSIPTMD